MWGWKRAGIGAGWNSNSPSCSVSCGIGEAAEISAKRVRKQKTDRQDAQLTLRSMLKDDFPQIWVPRWENRSSENLVNKFEKGDKKTQENY